jgi:hypothetical protein
VTELTERGITKATPWLKWRARLCLPGKKDLDLGTFPTTDDAARAYDAEVRRRGWAHVRPLNFPQPEELAAHLQASGERCDERGISLSSAQEPPVGAGAAQGASGQQPPKISGRKPGKGGFFGVTKDGSKCDQAAPWRAQMNVPGAKQLYTIGYFATRKEAARAYDAEIHRRGWTHVKRLNFPDPAGDAALLPSAAAAEAPGPD